MTDPAVIPDILRSFALEWEADIKFNTMRDGSEPGPEVKILPREQCSRATTERRIALMREAATEIASLRRELAELREDKRIVDELLDAAVEQRDEAAIESASLQRQLAQVRQNASTAMRFVEFAAVWAWRIDPDHVPPDKRLTDTERLSAIKYHPTVTATEFVAAIRNLAGEKADG